MTVFFVEPFDEGQTGLDGDRPTARPQGSERIGGTISMGCNAPRKPIE